MIITVQPDQRRAVLASPAVFSIESMEVTIKGADADAASLQLVLMTTAGVPIARCTSWTGDSTAGFVGTLDSRTEAADTFFAGKRPDERLPAVGALGDVNRPWFVQGVEVVNNPLRGAPMPLDPMQHYLTADLFAGLTLSSDATAAERGAVLRAILDRLQS